MESRELGVAPPVEQREGDRLNTPTLVPPKAIAPHEVTVPLLPQIPALTLTPATAEQKPQALPATPDRSVSNTQQAALLPPPVKASSLPSALPAMPDRSVSNTQQAALVPPPIQGSSVPPAQPAQTTFKAIGYVQKDDGELEAIISQENEIQVVHLGDEIAGRYRVTKITPDMVGAVDETMLQIPIVKPGGEVNPEVLRAQGVHDVKVADGVPQLPALDLAANSARDVTLDSPTSTRSHASSQARGENPAHQSHLVEHAANSLGYVQKSNGKVEAIVADGDSVRLVPEEQAETMAQNALPAGRELAPVGQGSAVKAESSTVGLLGAGSTTVIADAIQPQSGTNETAFRQGSRSEIKRIADISSGPGRSAGSGFEHELFSPGSAKLPSERVLFDEQALRDGNIPFEMRTMGFVEKSDGELAAILSAEDGVDIVWQGDKFAGHLRALSVSRDHVSAAELTLQHQNPVPFSTPLPISDIISESARKPLTFTAPRESANTLPLKKQSSAKSAIIRHGQYASAPAAATLIFQTLGYVESGNGEVQAIVADGNETYLVKRGQVFAGQYQATSVDSTLVVAVRVPPSKPIPDFLAPQTDSREKTASNIFSGFLQSPTQDSILPWSVSSQDGLARMGRTFGTSPFSALSSGLRVHLNFLTTDNPKPGY